MLTAWSPGAPDHPVSPAPWAMLGSRRAWKTPAQVLRERGGKEHLAKHPLACVSHGDTAPEGLGWAFTSSLLTAALGAGSRKATAPSSCS